MGVARYLASGCTIDFTKAHSTTSGLPRRPLITEITNLEIAKPAAKVDPSDRLTFEISRFAIWTLLVNNWSSG